MAATSAHSGTSPHNVSRASILDTLAFLNEVGLPTFAKGPLVRRRKVVKSAEKHDLDTRAVKRMQKLRRKYGPGPLVLRIPFRTQIVILAPDDAERILSGSPEPFAPASKEKRSALAHFEPEVSLASHGPEREDRRRFNEEALETGCPVHSMAERFNTLVRAEMDVVADRAEREGGLSWDIFFEGWYAMVRHIVLGPGARDDEGLTDLLEDLRYRGNYAFLKPKDTSARAKMLDRLQTHLDRAEPGSLAARIAKTKKTEVTKPEHQVPQWLFAFDPAAMASFRALALLAAHPEAERLVRAEMQEEGDQPAPKLTYLRACFLESLRLWPTTPAIFRESVREVPWGEGTIPANANILIFAPYFHRDDERLAFAHKLQPELWLADERREGLSLVPFSHGPGLCPAADFVPMIAAFALARLLERAVIGNIPGDRLGSPERLPGTLDNYRLAFSVSPIAPRSPPNGP